MVSYLSSHYKALKSVKYVRFFATKTEQQNDKKNM